MSPEPLVASASTPHLRLLDVTSSYGRSQVLHEASLELQRGEIHALIGGNGSGKSTLIKVLAGLVVASAGTLQTESESIELTHFGPHEARRLGLHFVHQNAPRFDDMTVAENLAIGGDFAQTRLGRIRWREQRRRTRTLLAGMAPEVSPDALVGSLGPAGATIIAIARAFGGHEAEPDTIILDEPTTALARAEVETLFASLRWFRSAGKSIVLITQRLEEVTEIADRVTVLRDGRNVVTLPTKDVGESELINLVAGRTVDRVFPVRDRALPDSLEPTGLEVRGLSGGPLRELDLGVAAGEIVGIAGLAGSGRTELLDMIFGLTQPSTGTISIDGRPARFRNPVDAMTAGVGYVPEDRPVHGVFADMSLAANLSAASVGAFWSGLRLRHQTERAAAADLVSQYQIVTSGVEAPISTLSGGNQQKAMLARWLCRQPRILLLDEPTQGVDVGARIDIYQLIRAAADGGAAVVLVSSDFEELAGLSDRIVVLRHGRICAETGGAVDEAAEITALVSAGSAA